MEDYTKLAAEIEGWHEGYIEGLKLALEIVNCRARFGIEKAVAGIQEEIEKHVEKNLKRAS